MSERDPWFDTLYNRYARSLLKTAVNLLDDQEVAEEIVQDVFVILLLHRSEVEDYNYPGAWLFKVLDNRIDNELFKARHKYEVPFDPKYEQIAAAEEATRLEDILPTGLSQKERQFLIWFYEDDLSHEEIAQRLGCSVHACHTKLYRIKRRCQKLLLKK